MEPFSKFPAIQRMTEMHCVGLVVTKKGCDGQVDGCCRNVTSVVDNLKLEKSRIFGSSTETQCLRFQSRRILKPKAKMEQVCVNWLYNYLQFSGGMTLIDTRPFELYKTGHIQGFISLEDENRLNSMQSRCPKVELENIENRIQQDAAKLRFKKRKLTTIVLMNQGGNIDANDWTDRISKLLMMEGQCTSIKIVTGGMEAFRRRFPFMVQPLETKQVDSIYDTKNGLHRMSYPNEIVDEFLYVGNQWQASEPTIVSNLGITHILSACVETSLRLPNVSYFQIPLKDKVDAPLSDYFDVAYEFIQKAKQEKGRILIHCVQGISRSATLAIMYICRAKRWSLVSTYNYVLARRNLIYPNLGFIIQLVKVELEEFGCASIRDFSEIDLLQGGLLQDRPRLGPRSLIRRAFVPRRHQLTRICRGLQEGIITVDNSC